MNSIYQIGQTVMDHWTITKLMGQGSYGKVFEITRSDFGTNYTAALKVMTIPSNESEIKMVLEEGMNLVEAKNYFYTIVESIVTEFSLMSKLKGMSNIVSYEDHAVVPYENGIGWDILIRMELLTPLLTHAYSNPFSRKDIIKLGIDICKALEVCQKYNIIHRDIKPENIFISNNGDYKLGDFGIARNIEKTTNGLSKKGTYIYMAPEVYRDESYGFSVDTYSLGIVLYRLLNKNRVPFLPQSPVSIKYSHREEALAMRIKGDIIPKPYYHQGRLPEIVLKACSFNPKDRYSTPGQMRQELESIIYDEVDAQIIYPTGDNLSIEENIYISTNGKVKNTENSNTNAIFGTHSTVDTSSKTSNVFNFPAKNDENLTSAIFTEKKTKKQIHQKIKTTRKQTKQKNIILPVLLFLAILSLGIGSFLYYQNLQNQQQLAEAATIIEAEQELVTTYNEYMQQATNLINTDCEGALELLLLAQQLQPDSPDPFVNYAYALYLSGDYNSCIDYITNDLALGKEYDIISQSTLSELLASAYFEQEDYAQAAAFFALSAAGGDLTVSAMRDYAVSLGRLGDIEAAEGILQTMFSAGATELETTYVQAEVDFAQEDYTDAQEGFRKVIDESEDNTLVIKAIRSLAEVYRDCAVLEFTGNSPISNAAILESELLAEYIYSYNLTYDSTLWEMLALAYFQAYSINSDLGETWLNNSADAFQQVIDLGIQKEYLYTNLYSIYYELQDYDSAEQILLDYEQVYPNSYTPHALRATMLIMLENEKDQLERDYNNAYEEYLTAESKLQSNDDSTYYQQVKSLIDTLFDQAWL